MKKFITSVLVCVMTLGLAVGFAACKKGETPAHSCENQKTEYVIDGGAVHYKSECTCGKTSDTVITNAVVLTPETAQGVLDGNIDGKTIVFNGTFTQKLSIRQTKATSKVYSYTLETITAGTNSRTKIIRGDEITGELTGVSKDYLYQRSVSNVTFAATKGTVLQRGFVALAGTGNFGASSIPTNYDSNKDYVISETGVEFTKGNGYMSTLKLNNLKFENMRFVTQADATELEANHSHLRLFSDSDLCEFNNIKVKGCTMIGSEAAKTFNIRLAGVYVGNSCFPDTIDGVTVEDCNVSGYAHGIGTWRADNVVIKRNVVSNTRHNSICVGSEDDANFLALNNGYISGKVVLEDNVLIDSGNMTIKIHSLQNATVSVKNNAVYNVVKIHIGWPYLFQQGNAINSSYVWSGNTFNGDKVKKIDGNKGNHDWFYIYVPGYVAA